jgi:hypothetical protein
MGNDPLRESAWEKAKCDTGAVITSAPFWAVSLVLAVIGAAVALLAAPKDASGTQTAGVTLLMGVGIPTIGALTLLLFQFVAAPVRQRNEARTELREAAQRSQNPEDGLRREEKRGDLLEAIAAISEELEFAATALETPGEYFFSSNAIPLNSWRDHGSTLSRQGLLSDHAVIRGAYNDLIAVNNSSKYRHDDYGNEYFDSKAGLIDAAKESVSVARQRMGDMSEMAWD